MLFRRGAGSGPGAARVFGAWRPAWRECRSAGAAFPRNTLQEIAEATSRGARPKAAKPHGPKRGRPLPKGPFTAPEARLPSRQRMLPLKPGQVNDLRLLYQPGILNTARQKKGYDIYAITLEKYGAPGEIRTAGLQVRSLLLYPAELQAHCENGN